jgi:hypothetical protein
MSTVPPVPAPPLPPPGVSPPAPPAATPLEFYEQLKGKNPYEAAQHFLNNQRAIVAEKQARRRAAGGR